MPEKPAAYFTIHDIGTLDRVGFETPIQPASTFSLAFWFFAADTGHKQVMVDISQNISVWLDDHQIIAGTDNTVVFTDYPDLDHWHHVVLIVTQHQLSLYVDSQFKSSAPLLEPVVCQSNAQFRIGGYTDPAGGHFDHTFGRNSTGWVDDVRYYDFALDLATEAAFYPDTDDLPDVNISRDGTHFTAITEKPERFRFFLWDFGDGDAALGQQVMHSYAYSGDYTVKLRAVAHDYMESIASLTIHIENASPPLQSCLVFTNETEDYACYRIPSIVCAANGDLVAFAEGRVESCSDSTSTIRLVCKRSTDNGQTWSNLQVVARNIVNGREYVVQNSAPVVDRNTGRIILLYNKMEHNEWQLSAGEGQSRIYATFSDDHGTTWHTETDITAQVQRTEWQVQRPTIGHAIQLKSGRLFFAGVFTTNNRSVFQSQNYAFWSDDGGKTWVIGGIIPTVGLNEAIAVELESGNVMVNSRAYHNEKSVGKRAATRGIFTDANTIDFEPTAFDDTLIDPAVQASLIRYTTSEQETYGGKSRLLFCNPNHPQSRYNLTVRLSYDEGKTWAISKVIDAGASAYSDLVIQDDMKIGVLYERGNQGGIVYASFSLEWLTDGQDSVED
ncbi:MAG: exo-alpha-sialidase [Chloroflexota bacterium]